MLDVGCGKAHIIYELKKLIPDIEIVGIDRSVYGLSDVPEEISEFVINHRAEDVYPWDDKYFDLVISINTLHNLYYYQQLMSEIRLAIESGQFGEYVQEFQANVASC